MTTYVLFNEQNRKLDTFAAPACRLAGWDKLPDGWCIEEFDGTVSRGLISLDEVKRRAIQAVVVPDRCGAGELACEIAREFSLRQ